MANCPEWKNVPSPRFWKMWLVSTKSLMPIHWVPSLPMQVRPAMSPTRSGSMSKVMVWQPIPAPTTAPSGTSVLRLWGQPEQKNGERSTASGIMVRSRGRGARRSSRRGARRARSTGMMLSASRPPQSGSMRAPVSSVLPTITGRSATAYSASLISDSMFGDFSSTTTSSVSPREKSRTV